MRDVLLQLGARAYMTITPYGCGSIHSGEARSPRVELKFQLPEVLSGSATRYAQITVNQRARHGVCLSLHGGHPVLCTDR